MNDLGGYIGDGERFPILKNWTFFNHAGVAPIPRAAGEAIRRFAGEAENGAYLDTTWYRDIELLRRSAAGLINAVPDEIAFVKNTSEGISVVANGIDWQWGNRIVTTNVEYPANIYPWMEVARARGVKLVMVEEETDADGRRHVPLERILQEAAHADTRLVTLSHVEYASGQRHDLARIGRFCRENGKLFCVDAIQSLGVLPVDVREMNIDYLSADGHKWMLGPEGAGFMYCRQDLLEHTRPLMVGWMNVIDALDFGNYNYTLKSSAGRFECGSHNVAGLMGLKASLDLLRTAGITAISNRVKALTDQLIVGLYTKGYQIISPRGGGQWSGIVSFTSPVHSHEPLVMSLRKEHGVEIALREGRMRASPHFYNTEEQIIRLIELLPGH